MVKETRKRRGRALKVKKETAMETEEKETPPVTGHALHTARAAEWKAVKSVVARLKEERKKLGKQEREKKKTLSKEIKRLLDSEPQGRGKNDEDDMHM